MPTTITFFPVDNGDMTLIRFGDADKTTLLIDCNIRLDADNPEADVRDVARDLRDKLQKDTNGRPYVDAFLLSHPDEDHCRGLTRHFYLGPLDTYPDDNKAYKEKRIVIREIWSSPLVFRRASKNHKLCGDASAFNTEARRRVKVNEEKNFVVGEGDRIQIMGEDINGKTDKLGKIVRKVDTTFNTINGTTSKWFSAFLLGPLGPQDEEDEEELLAKNQSSVIVQLSLSADALTPNAAKFLTGGDAEAYIWEQLLDRHKTEMVVLQYDLLQAPHHCSWHSLSHESWSDTKGKAKVAEDARSALSQALDGASIVASCKPIEDDYNDPPCIGAKREYEAIVKGVNGQFYCTGEYPKKGKEEPLEFTVGDEGLQPPGKKESGKKAAAIVGGASTPLPHGRL